MQQNDSLVNGNSCQGRAGRSRPSLGTPLPWPRPTPQPAIGPTSQPPLVRSAIVWRCRSPRGIYRTGRLCTPGGRPAARARAPPPPAAPASRVGADCQLVVAMCAAPPSRCVRYCTTLAKCDGVHNTVHPEAIPGHSRRKGAYSCWRAGRGRSYTRGHRCRTGGRASR